MANAALVADGESILSSRSLCVNDEVTTISGSAANDALLDRGAFYCGYCTSRQN